jgi:hypothetical protein
MLQILHNMMFFYIAGLFKIYFFHLTKEMPNKTVLKTEVNTNQLQRTAGSYAVLGRPHS